MSKPATHAVIFSDKSLDRISADDISLVDFVESEAAGYRKVKSLQEKSPHCIFFVVAMDEYCKLDDVLIRVTRNGCIQRLTLEDMVRQINGH